MTTSIEAIYERGMLRPVKPLQLPEGTHLHIVLVKRDDAGKSPIETLAEIAALPEESTGFAGRDHDAILYPEKSGA